MWNLQTYYHFKLDLWTNIQEASGKSRAPNAARTTSYKAWNTHYTFAIYISYINQFEING